MSPKDGSEEERRERSRASNRLTNQFILPSSPRPSSPRSGSPVIREPLVTPEMQRDVEMYQQPGPQPAGQPEPMDQQEVQQEHEQPEPEPEPEIRILEVVYATNEDREVRNWRLGDWKVFSNWIRWYIK